MFRKKHMSKSTVEWDGRKEGKMCDRGHSGGVPRFHRNGKWPAPNIPYMAMAP